MKATALCPVHGDRTPSLSIEERDGRILLNCFAGCTAEAICEAIGIKLSDLFLDDNNHNRAGPLQAAVPSPSVSTIAGTEQDVEEMRAAFARDSACQKYVEGRGVALKVAADLRWGYKPSWQVRDERGELVPKPMLAIPHYAGGRLVGIKFRTIDGSKMFSQMPGSSTDGLYARMQLDQSAPAVSIFEGPEDCGLAISHGFNSVAINSARAKITDSDIHALKNFSRIFLVGDQDPEGQRAIQALAGRLPAEQIVRVRMPRYKDIGDLWRADPLRFAETLRGVLRLAEGSRDRFELADILDEDEISETKDLEKYAVEKLVPCQAITMFFGEEKGGKSLLARYVGKCVANGVNVFGKYATRKMPVICLDLENNPADIRQFTRHFARLGPEKIRYRTRWTNVPALDSPSLISISELHRPLIILDSMTKFLGGGVDPFHPGQMSAFFDKLLNLCAAGATIIVIHHATRADVERYANSHQIGANVARSFCVVSEDRPRLNRVRLEGQLFRGGEPVSENLIAFPVITEQGIFAIDQSRDPYAAELDHLVAFVEKQKGGQCFRETIKNRRGHGHAKNLELLKVALARGILVEKGAKVASPNSRTSQSDFLASPDTGTGQDA